MNLTNREKDILIAALAVYSGRATRNAVEQFYLQNETPQTHEITALLQKLTPDDIGTVIKDNAVKHFRKKVGK